MQQRALGAARVVAPGLTGGRHGPRLKDLFELVKTRGHAQVKFAIESKITPQRPDQTPEPERFVRLLLQEIKDHDMSEQVQILSFDWRTL